MWFRSAFDFLKSRPSSNYARRRPRQAKAARLQLEALEDRSLPSTFTVLNLNDAGPDSLRQAIVDANSPAYPGADVIWFAPRLAGTIGLTGGEISITDDLTIAGPGARKLTISGGNLSRVFAISGAETDVDISGLTIADGNGVGVPVVDPLFGPIQAGGGILNDGAHVTLSRMAFVGNEVAAPGIVEGGAVANFNGGRLTVEASTFSDNLASSTFAFGAGGAIASANGSALTVRASTFSGNRTTAGFIAIGGAISMHNDGTATVEGSRFLGNQARGGNGAGGAAGGQGWGGAISTGSAALTISDSSFWANEARGGDGGSGPSGVKGGDGSYGRGGALNTGPYIILSRTPQTEIVRSQFVSNRAVGGNGGAGGAGASGGVGGNGVGGALDAAGGTTIIRHSLMAQNQALGGAGGNPGAGSLIGGNGGAGAGGAILNSTGNSLTLFHSVLIANQAVGGAGGAGGNGGVGQGGGICNLARGGVSSTTIYGSLIIGNCAVGGRAGPGGSNGVGQGGGIYNEKAEFDGIILIDPLTVILGNRADEGPDCFGC